MRTTGISDIFKKKTTNKSGYIYAPTMGGDIPYNAYFGNNIYASDIIIQAIRCKANEFKKLDPRHIITKDGKQTIISDSSIAKVLKRPNPYMTQADFLEKITILLELNKNVYIYPEYYITNGGERYYTALYPLTPSNVEYLTNDKGRFFISMKFLNGKSVIFPLDSIIHWRKDYGINDYFGGCMLGGNENNGLLQMLKRFDELTHNIAKAIGISCKINGIVKYNSYNDTEDLRKSREDFEKDLKDNKSGILFTDLKAEYIPVARDIKIIDSETLKFLYETILRLIETPLNILNGDYTKSQKEAWYEHSLEADIKGLGQAMSKVMFTDRQMSFGNEIILYPNSIEFMAMSEKISALQTGLPAGIFTRNEARALLGYPPIENGDEIPQGYNNIINQNVSNKNKEDENANE